MIGYEWARQDLADWISHHPDLAVIVYPGGGSFDRLLGDLHVTGDVSDTASQWMMRERGWLPWIGTQ